MFCKEKSNALEPLKTYENNNMFKNAVYCLKVIKQYGLFDEKHFAQIILPEIASIHTNYHPDCHKRYTNIKSYKNKFAAELGQHESRIDETLRARSDGADDQSAANRESRQSIIENMEEDEYDSDEDSDWDPEAGAAR